MREVYAQLVIALRQLQPPERRPPSMAVPDPLFDVRLASAVSAPPQWFYMESDPTGSSSSSSLVHGPSPGVAVQRFISQQGAAAAQTLLCWHPAFGSAWRPWSDSVVQQLLEQELRAPSAAATAASGAATAASALAQQQPPPPPPSLNHEADPRSRTAVVPRY